MNNIAVDARSFGLQNEKRVLALLKQRGQLSQTQLCRQAGFSSSTASYVMARLREKGLILEEPGQSNKRGAKPTLVRINPRGRYAVGIELSPSNISLGLFGFTGEFIEHLMAPIDPDHDPQKVVDLLEINLRGLLSKNDVDPEKLIGIGITLSGSISADGVVELSSPLGWKGVPLKQMLETRFAAPISVHTTRVRLLAENSIQPPLDSQNILYFNVGNGVGGHVITDGHLIHGATSRSGELGHIVVEPDGPLCGCGNKGCLEAFISGPALTRTIRGDLRNQQDTLLQKTVIADDIPETVIAKWGEALRQNDPYSLQLRNRVAGYLSRVATMAINMYDPEIVILAGYVSEQCFAFLADFLRKAIPHEVYDSSARSLRIMAARAGRHALILGVATAILQEEFKIL